MRPLVSVHITTYNRAAKLERCVRSVWPQSYPNIEIIIADDCSPDDTPAVVERLTAESPVPITYVRHETNKGNAFARNSCLTVSSGHYVAFLDDDDEWIDPEKITKQVQVLEQDEQGIGFVATLARIHEPAGVRESPAALPRRLVPHILRRNGLFFNSSVLTTRITLKRTDGFDEDLPRGVDSDFYRFCIVNLGCRPILMQGVTTLVHAEDEGRMTDYASVKSLRKEVASHKRTLHKYRPSFLRHPCALLFRWRKIAVARIRALKRAVT